MAIDRLLRANRAVVLMPLIDLDGVNTIVSPTGTTTPFAAPTAAVLEAWRAITLASDANAPFGGNISGAVLDDMDLGLAASDTDTELVVTSLGNEQSATFRNVDAALTVLRDRNKADVGVYNLATGLLNGPDSRFAVLDRIGYPAGTAVAVGQVVSVYELFTDVPIDTKGDRGNLKLAQTLIPSGLVTSNYTIAA